MRPVLIIAAFCLAAVPAAAGASGSKHARTALATLHLDFSHLDFGKAGEFSPASAPESSGTDLLLNRPMAAPPGINNTETSGMRVGPFHATLSGLSTEHTHVGVYQPDTRDFMRASVSGNAEHRGARLTFTLPTR